jgi:hypothetical protein
VRIAAPSRVFGNDRKGQSATGRESGLDFHPARLAGLNQVIQDLVDDMLIEGMDVSVRRQIKLERLGLNAELIRNVLDEDLSEIGLARHRAEGSEIRAVEADSIIAAGLGVWKGLDSGGLGRSGKRRLRISEQRQAGVFLRSGPVHVYKLNIADPVRGGNLKAGA